MKTARRVTATILIALWILPLTVSADVIGVSPISCVSPSMNAHVFAQVPSTLTLPRVYFKATGAGPEYYVDMHRGANGNWWAVLPAILASTKSITYRVGAIDAARKWVVSSPVALPATSACPQPALTADEQRAADHIVLGLTANDQPAVPPGFSCRGITNIIAVNGQMRPADECRAERMAAVGPAGGATGATGAAGISNTAKIAALGAAAFAIGYAAGHNSGQNKPISPKHP